MIARGRSVVSAVEPSAMRSGARPFPTSPNLLTRMPGFSIIPLIEMNCCVAWAGHAVLFRDATDASSLRAPDREESP